MILFGSEIIIGDSCRELWCLTGFPGVSGGLSWWLLHCRIPGFDPWVGKIPWRREQLPTPVFWPGEFYGQRILAGYSPWGHK